MWLSHVASNERGKHKLPESRTGCRIFGQYSSECARYLHTHLCLPHNAAPVPNSSAVKILNVPVTLRGDLLVFVFVQLQPFRNYFNLFGLWIFLSPGQLPAGRNERGERTESLDIPSHPPNVFDLCPFSTPHLGTEHPPPLLWYDFSCITASCAAQLQLFYAAGPSQVQEPLSMNWKPLLFGKL